MFCAPSRRFVFRMARDTSDKAVYGGQITMSTSLMLASSRLSPPTRSSASATVLFIFQLPAKINLRVLSTSQFSNFQLSTFNFQLSALHPFNHSTLLTLLTLLPLHPFTSASAATPGSWLPSRNSRLAPPPVLAKVTRPVNPVMLSALTLSPPPMMLLAPCRVASATARATANVPAENRSSSNTPMGPFH